MIPQNSGGCLVLYLVVLGYKRSGNLSRQWVSRRQCNTTHYKMVYGAILLESRDYTCRPLFYVICKLRESPIESGRCSS